jgi:hypothetical protein
MAKLHRIAENKIAVSAIAVNNKHPIGHNSLQIIPETDGF